MSPFGIAVVKQREVTLWDAGTIDRVDLSIQYQIKK